MTSATPSTNDHRSPDELLYCAAPPRTIPALRSDMAVARQRAIIVSSTQWVNRTTLRYTFVDPAGGDDQKVAVRAAFAEWKALDIGLEFQESADPAQSEVRIGFDPGDGSWSYVGRDVLGIAANERTMNFGWDLTTPYGRTTALHEIGHTLGMPHEHQNPNAGIVWDEDAVYALLGAPPNSWDRDTVFSNVLRKLDPSEVAGSSWDPDSVMEYEFPAGLIVQPAAYAGGIRPPGTLSDEDKLWVRRWYPGAAAPQPTVLQPFSSHVMDLAPAEQFDAEIRPDAGRKYSIGTFGATDVIMVLFEDVDGELRYLAADDDSGEERNALIEVRLQAGRRYVVRVRMFYAWASGRSSIMYW